MNTLISAKEKQVEQTEDGQANKPPKWGTPENSLHTAAAAAPADDEDEDEGTCSNG